MGGPLKTLANQIGVGGLAGLGSQGLANAIPKPPVAPTVAPVIPMPIAPANDPAALAAEKQKQIKQLQAAGGRASTILSQKNDTLG